MKLKISQIKKLIRSNIKGTEYYIIKQEATNNWFVRSYELPAEEVAIKLKELGFKIIRVQKGSEVVFAEFLGVDETYYARQIKEWV
jgi:hypothetical protein